MAETINQQWQPDFAQKVLDAVHNYLPVRAQAWIEDRAFIKATEASYARSDAARGIDTSLETSNTPQWNAIVRSERDLAMLQDAAREGVSASQQEPKGADEQRYVKEQQEALKHRSTHNDWTERQADIGPELAALENDGRNWPNSDDLRKMREERTIADDSIWASRQEWLKQFDTEKGQPDLFDKSIIANRNAESGVTHDPTKTEAYRIEHAYHNKHFPQISQEQRDAARDAASAPPQTDQMSLRLADMQKSSERGIER